MVWLSGKLQERSELGEGGHSQFSLDSTRDVSVELLARFDDVLSLFNDEVNDLADFDPPVALT